MIFATFVSPYVLTLGHIFIGVFLRERQRQYLEDCTFSSWAHLRLGPFGGIHPVKSSEQVDMPVGTCWNLLQIRLLKLQ